MLQIIYLFKLRVKMTIRKFKIMNKRVVRKEINFQIVIHFYNCKLCKNNLTVLFTVKLSLHLIGTQLKNKLKYH